MFFSLLTYKGVIGLEDQTWERGLERKREIWLVFVKISERWQTRHIVWGSRRLIRAKRRGLGAKGHKCHLTSHTLICQGFQIMYTQHDIKLLRVHFLQHTICLWKNIILKVVQGTGDPSSTGHLEMKHTLILPSKGLQTDSSWPPQGFHLKD